ncbi:non-ribosomal peptide synthetase [Imhoffiella purpurea]|nr:non-ribosomal peptide synthetase [Imhoffiella purpurea]
MTMLDYRTAILQAATDHSTDIAVADAVRSLTYAELAGLAGGLAEALRRIPKPSQGPAIAAILCRSGSAQVAATLGTAASGLAFMPIDPDLPPARIRAMLEKARPFVLVHVGATGEAAGSLAPEIPSIDLETLTPETLQVDTLAPNAASYLMFTSGSTGVPKGILGRHKSLDHFLRWQRATFELTADTITAQLAPVTFDVSLRDILLPLTLGGQVTIPPRETIADPPALLRWIEARGVTLLHCVPSLLRLLAQARAAQPEPERASLERLTMLFLAGEPLFGRDLMDWRAVAGREQRIVNLYGPSETTLAKLYEEIDAGTPIADGILPVGRCLPDTAALVLKPDRPALTGEIGEICIRTAFPSLGYVNDPEATREVFQKNPFGEQQNDLIYRSGDLGRMLPDGRLECLGRRDAQVKIAGNRVEAGEVELALRTAPGIDLCAMVVDREDPADPFLIAYLVGPGSRDADRLRAHLASLLPAYMTPRFMVPLDELPLLMNGKVDKRSLPRPDALVHGAAGPVAAANPTEALLEGLWRKVLKVERIGVETPFADLGGDSLKAIKLVGEIFRATGQDLKIADFFEARTIRRLAELMGPGETSAAPAGIPQAVPAPQDPLSDTQEQLWAMHRIGMSPVAYNLCYGFRAGPGLDLDRLERAFQSVMESYDILRTRILEIDSVPCQRVDRNLEFRIERRVLADASDVETLAESLLIEERERPFDLSQPPLLRLVAAAAASGAETILVVTFHHAVCDGESLDIFVQRLGDAYATDGPTPAPRLQYRDVVAWQAERLRSETAQGLDDYWRRVLSRAPESVELPEAKARPARQAFEGRTLHQELPPALADTLSALAQARGTSLFALLLSGLAIAMEQRSCQSDMVIGTPVLGRNHPDLDNQIGFFANTLPLRLRLHDQETVAELIDRTTRDLREALDHQEWPFQRMIAGQGRARDLSRNPICNLLLVFYDADRPELQLPGVALSPLGRDTEWRFSRFDLVFHVTHDRRRGAFTLALNYDTALFDAEQVVRIARHYGAILEQLMPGCESPVADLTPYDADQAALVARLDRSHQGRPARSLTRIFSDVVEERADRIAVSDETGSLTYAELDRLGNGIAHDLIARGLQPEEAVAVLGVRSILGIAGILGILKAGGAYVALDERWPRTRIEATLDWAEIRHVLTALPMAELPASRTRIDPGQIAPVRDAVDRARPEGLAYILFTSGSTGEPKGVLIEHAGVANMIREQIETFGMTENSRVLQFAAPVFDASISEIFTALLSGGRLAIPSQATVEHPSELRHFMERTRVSVATLPPSYLAVIGDHLPDSLATLVSAGEPARVEDARRFGARLRLFNAYGPAENSVCSTIFRTRPETPGPRIPIGRPIAGCGLAIRDPKDRPCPIGVPGEIRLHGLGLARGYLKRPDLTAAAFTKGPDGADTRVYRTGDMGILRDDGELLFAGRNDGQIKVAGQRLELDEVAETLRGAPEVAEAVVTPLGDEGRYTSVGAWILRRPGKVGVWPSIAELFVYDDILYSAMATDRGRNLRYMEGFRRYLPGKTVLEVGPGPYAVLSRMAVEAGARYVYAIEINPEIADRARATVSELGLEERIRIVTGDASSIQLPEKVDWCISEIVGSIGGSEGAAVILKAARTLLKSPENMLPRRTETRIAALELPADEIEPGFSPLAARYVTRIFEQRGRPFDLRLCLRRLDRERLLTGSDVFERLDFTRDWPLEDRHRIALEALRDGRFTGFLLWLTLDVGANREVDILQTTSSWLPIYVPISLEGFALRTGDRIEGTLTRTLDTDGLHPNFHLSAAILREGEPIQAFEVAMPHTAGDLGGNPLRDHLFDDQGAPREVEDSFLEDVRAHALRHLPRYAVPSLLREIETLPRTVSGKLARDELPDLVPTATERHDEEPGEVTETARTIARVFAEILGQTGIDPHRSFFGLGGDSIAAIRAVGALGKLGIGITATDIFQYQSAVALAAHARDASPSLAEAQTGPAALHPIQHWFLSRCDGGPIGRFNQSILVDLPESSTPDRVERALAALTARHPALSFRLDRQQARLEPSGTPCALEQHDLRTHGAREAEAYLERLAEQVHSGFDPETGRLLAAHLLRLSSGDRLFLAAHHLAVDLLSWRILLDDLAALLEEPETALPSPATSYGALTAALAREAQSPTTVSERHYWSRVAAVCRTLGLPIKPNGSARNATHRFEMTLIHDQLSPDLLGRGNGREPLASGLLLAMAEAAQEVFGWPESVIDVETHGRDLPAHLPAAGDLVGWLTRITPVHVTAGSREDPLAALPRGGLGHALLAWMREDGRDLRDAQAPLALNYLGDLSGDGPADRLRVDWNGLGNPIDPSFRTGHALALLAHRVAEGLYLSVTADLALIDEEQGQHFVEALRHALDRSSGIRHAHRASELDMDDLADRLGL